MGARSSKRLSDITRRTVTVDVEDGLKKGAFSYDEFVDSARRYEGGGSMVAKFVDEQLVLPSCGGTRAELQQLAFQQFRVFAIGRLTGATVKAFVANYDKIMDGQIAGDLIKECDHYPLVAFLKDFGKSHVYCAGEVVKTERAAKRVVRGLLDILWDETLAARSGRASKLLAVLLRNVDGGASSGSADYQACQQLADYVAGMTDSYAHSLFARLNSGTP